jgi:hypothetical protein
MKFPTKKVEKEKYVKEFFSKFEKPATTIRLIECNHYPTNGDGTSNGQIERATQRDP